MYKEPRSHLIGARKRILHWWRPHCIGLTAKFCPRIRWMSVVNKMTFLVMFFSTLLTACMHELPRKEPPQSPPETLTDLPRQIMVLCHNDSVLDEAMYPLWERPGDLPNDSSFHYLGQQTGVVPSCAVVIANKHQWSYYEGIYYLYIDYGDSNEGWLSAEYLELE